MPVSTVTYTANGSTNQFSITFPYIDAAHVLVSVNGSSASFTFHNSTTAQLSSTPTSGQTVVVYRQTPSSALVDFTDGSTLFESDLDLANTQARYLSEEARDRADSAITTVTANKANIDTVAGISGDVTTVAGISGNVTTVAGDTAEIAALAGKTTEISALSTSANIANMTTLGASGVVGNIATVAGVAPTMSAAATNAINAAASASAAANSAAAAASSFDTFDDRYLGSKSSEPSADNDGNALISGALFFDSAVNSMKVYDGSDWVAATSSGAVSLLEYEYTATAGQTTFTGADNNSATLGYSAGNIIVSLNGITLDNGSDYAADNNYSIVLASGAAAGDHLAIVAFKSFNVADAVSATTGGTFGGSISLGDNTKLKLGSAPDLEIFHDGSNSYINEIGEGFLAIQATSVGLFEHGSSDSMIVATGGGAVTLYYDGASKLASTATGINVTGEINATGGITVDSTSSFEEIKEKVLVNSSTTGTLTHALATGPAIIFCNVDQTANRTVNLTGANAFLSSGSGEGQSTTVVILFKQGSTAYYPNAFQIDGASVTPEWQGGSAPTDGNANSIDSYSYTIIKTASSTYTVLASKTQFA